MLLLFWTLVTCMLESRGTLFVISLLESRGTYKK